MISSLSAAAAPSRSPAMNSSCTRRAESPCAHALGGLHVEVLALRAHAAEVDRQPRAAPCRAPSPRRRPRTPARTGDTSTVAARRPHGREDLLAAVGVEEEREPAVGDLAPSAPPPSGRWRPGRSGCRPAAGGSAASAACPGPCPRPAAGTPRPRTRAGPRARAPCARSPRTRACARAAARTRRRASPPDTCGPDTPRPSRKRPSESVSSVAAVMAVIAGVRAGIWNRPEPRPIALGHRAHVAEHGGGVLAPGLGDPHRVESLAVGLAWPGRSAPRGRTRASRRGRARCACADPMAGRRTGG